ncbi:hypothetical protein Tco_0997321 [Tanacetum coccineum]
MANVPEEITRGSASQFMGNDVNGSGFGVMANDVNGSIPSVIDNGVDRFVSQVRVNGVSRSVHRDVVNGVVCNGVGGSAVEVINYGVSVIANDVGGLVSQVQADGVIANGVGGFVDPGMANGVSGSVAFVTQVDKDRLLGYFIQEFRKDIARVREYRAIASGLRITLDDVEKVTRALLMMREMEAKIREKARCHELRRSCCSKEREDMFILYCRRAAAEDGSLAREINGLCDGLTTPIEEREFFFDELDTLADIFVPEKMAKFLKETQDKDRNRLMRLQILGREFELRAAKKNQFIEKLKGNVDF